MAFFCPGSNAKIKKEFIDSQKRPNHLDNLGSSTPHSPHTGNSRGGSYNSPQTNGRHVSITQDVSSPQTPVSTQFFQKMIVLYDHYPEREMELTVRKGERIEVIKKEPEWLFVRNERGKEGYVPARNCVPPVTSSRRTRSNSRSSIPIRPVKSGEVDNGDNGGYRRRGIPIYSSNSAGIVRRDESPITDTEQDRHGVNSPPTQTISPLINGYQDYSSNESSSTTFEVKGSPSPPPKLLDPYSPSLVRAHSQDQLTLKLVDDSMCSLSQSAIDPSTSVSGFDKITQNIKIGHRKYYSSESNSTVDQLKDVEYASTIRNVDSSSEEGSSSHRISSGGTTPSMRDRPLPSPPKSSKWDSNSFNEDTPPPVPPRHASLDRSKREFHPSPDDLDPYAQPVDSIMNGDTTFVTHRPHRKSPIDISEQNSGIESPYSEVYRGKGQRRPINLSEGVAIDLMQQNRRSSSFTHHRSSNPSSHRIERRRSPLVNGDRQITSDEVFSSEKKSLSKFRKYMWGVFICINDFEGIDENEVSVKTGETVLVFNQDDKFWSWIAKHKTDNTEGFVPANILKEVVTDKIKSRVDNHSVKSHPGLPSGSRPRGHSTAARHSYNTSPRRQRLNSAGSSSHQRPVINSMEKLPVRNILTPSPASPPPPYTERDPIPLFVSSQPYDDHMTTQSQDHHVTTQSQDHHVTTQSHDRHVTTQPQSLSMSRTQSSSIMRNRPPTFPLHGTRVSASHMYPSSPSQPIGHNSHMTQSSSQLVSPMYRDHHASFPCSPVSSTGGTLV